MAKIIITINTGSDAFGETPEELAHEVARALEADFYSPLQEGETDGTLRDYNGNTTGHWLLDS